MPRFTVSVDDDHDAWIRERAEEYDQSKSWVFRQLVDAAREGGEPFTVTHRDGDTATVNSGEEVTAAVDELRERVEELEATLEQPTAAETPNPSPEIRETPTPEGGKTGLQDADSGGDVTERVTVAVDAVASSWQDSDSRLAARREAAHAALEFAVRTAEPIGKTEAINQFYRHHSVDGQTEETWWRKNIRPVLKEYGEYSRGAHGYVVEETALPTA